MNRFISPHDSKAARRRRNSINGPEGDEPAEFDPVHLSRVMRCPKCRATIATMRRWRMLCSDCGHEWEEESVRSLGDKLSDMRTEVWGYLFLGLAWGTIIAIGAGILGLFVLFFLWLHRNGATLAGAFAVVVLAMLIVALFSALMRSSNEAAARYQYFMPWRSNRERD